MMWRGDETMAVVVCRTCGSETFPCGHERDWAPGATYFNSRPGKPFAGPPRDCPYGGREDRCCVFSYTQPPCATAKRLLNDEPALARNMRAHARRTVRHIDWVSVLLILLAIVIVVGFMGWLIVNPTVSL
jgi:hypothetical protein